MATRPYVSFTEVREKVPLPAVLDALNVTGVTKRGTDKWRGICPLPSHPTGPNRNDTQFTMDTNKGVWLYRCWGDCQRAGDVIDFAKAMTGYDDKKIRFWFAEHFADRLSLTKPKATPPAPTKKVCDAPAKDTSQTAAKSTPSVANPPSKPQPLTPLRWFYDLQQENVEYLQRRGVTPAIIKKYGIGLCAKPGKYLTGYIAIPLYGHPHPRRANPYAYLGRWAGEPDDEHPRFKLPEGFPKSQIVYGLSQALAGDRTKPIIVVEGPFAVYHLVQCGYPHTVAVFGSSMSDEQAAILHRTGRPIVLCFDGDEAGLNGMRHAAAKLITKPHSFVNVVKLPEGKQPGDLSAEQLREVL